MTKGWGERYVDMPATPLYPFGYGLSYTNFEYSNLRIDPPQTHSEGSVKVLVDVKNVGKRPGTEVVQLYITFPKVPGTPLRALRGFTRVHVPAGGTQHVQLTLNSRDLSFVNKAGDRAVYAGAYSISVGGGQPGTGAAGVEAKLSIHGEQKFPE